MPSTKKSGKGMMRVGQLYEMFAEFAYPQEGQAMLTHAGRNRAGFRSPAEPPLRLSLWLLQQ